MHARLGAERLFVGRPDALTGPGWDTVSVLQAQGKTVVMVSRDSQPLGLLAVADRLRADSRSVVEELRRLEVERIVMLAGDNSCSAEAIGRAAGVDEWRASLLPADKSAAIAELSRTTGPVAMVGDGINDAPALALADVGVAMGATGTTVALETADIALMAGELDKLPAAIRLARRSMRTVRQNVAVSLLPIGVLVAAALAGRLSLTEGLLLNEGTALIIIANGLRLLRGVHHQQTETPDCTTVP